MAERSVALIIGANRGIGLGVAREFLARGWTVIATARRPTEAQDLATLAARHPGQVEIVPLDVNDSVQIEGFAKAMKGRTLDVALINAGVAGPTHRSADAATIAEIGALMYTNAIAPIRLARTLLDDIRRGSGVLAFTTSAMGSVSLNSGGHELYRASKAALNSLTRGLVAELGSRPIAVLSLHPGWVRTDMGGAGAPVSVEQSAAGLVDVIEKARGSHRHAFLDYTGKEIAW